MKQHQPYLLLVAFVVLCAATPRLDGATITNSGSTNAAGWTIALRSNEVGTLTVPSRPSHTFRVPANLAATFFRDLAAARASGLPNVQTCMKSVSFGSSTIARWHGFASPDFGCPQHGRLGAALADEVAQIERIAGVPGLDLRRRVYPIPTELRRTEPTQTPRQGP